MNNLNKHYHLLLICYHFHVLLIIHWNQSISTLQIDDEYCKILRIFLGGLAMFKHIGLRTIKTGIAVGLSVIVSNFLKLEFPFFVCMTSIFSMDKTAITSLKMGRNRVIGTLIGAILGVLFASIERQNPILVGLGVIILICICNYFKLPGAIGVGGIVFCACMVHINTDTITPLEYGFNRTLDSFIGVLVSLAVNLTILPNYNVDKVHNRLNNLIDDLEHLLLECERQDLNFSIDEINYKNRAKEIQDDITLYEKEWLGYRKKTCVRNCAENFRIIEKVLFELDVLQTLSALGEPEIYNYHHQKAIDYMHQIDFGI